MAIKRILKKKFHNVTMRSGHIYSLHYRAWHNDPDPTVIFMYSLEGIHPNTGHQWHFLQCINFTYVPRIMRRAFAKDWAETLKRTNGNTNFTWNICQRRYPYLKGAVRRYFFKPNYYISKLKEVPFEKMEDAVVSTWSKDFSKKIRTSLFKKFKRVLRNRNKI